MSNEFYDKIKEGLEEGILHNINHRLATEVMGWELITVHTKDDYYHMGDKIIKYASDWNPTTDLNQSMECVEKIKDTRWYGKFVRNLIWNSEGDEGCGMAAVSSVFYNLDALAICKAILEALDA